MKRKVLFITTILAIVLFYHHISIIIINGLPELTGERISLILSLVGTLLVSIGVYLQWKKFK